MKGNSIQILVIQSRYSQWNGFQVLVQNSTSPALGKLQKLAIKQGGEMTGPNQSLQFFQKKKYENQFLKNQCYGEGEKLSFGAGGGEHFYKGTQKNTKLSSNVLFCFHWPLRTFLQAPAKMLRVLNDFSGWKHPGTI